jgi:hypothetical protein
VRRRRILRTHPLPPRVSRPSGGLWVRRVCVVVPRPDIAALAREILARVAAAGLPLALRPFDLELTRGMPAANVQGHIGRRWLDFLARRLPGLSVRYCRERRMFHVDRALPEA